MVSSDRFSETKARLNAAQLRAECARRFARILNPKQQHTLDRVLSPGLSDVQQHAWMSAALYGACRFYYRYRYELITRLEKPLREADADIEALLVLGMYQLSEMRTKPYAAINETVNACQVLRKAWAKSLVNAILRSYQREQEKAGSERDETVQFAHPKWYIKRVKQDWPDEWDRILQANNEQAPMTLRVNSARWGRDEALANLHAAMIPAKAVNSCSSAINLDQATDVYSIPLFSKGYYSVQDASAQLAAGILLSEMEKGQDLDILDACAAPGGKTGHLFETMSQNSRLKAVEKYPNRAELIQDNLKRIGLEKNVQLIISDVVKYMSDSSNQYDRILADVPCTATGVVRRHPDIKLRRIVQQLEVIKDTQLQILQALWERLKPGGRLLYATCSILREENHEQISRFVTTQHDVKVLPLSLPESLVSDFGTQILPGSDNRDGFFYALLEKDS